MNFETRAETWYVSESFEITMRTGPGAERKIIALIKSGTKVEILESSEKWTKIHYKNRDGWVSTRYLSSDKPCSTMLSSLKQSHAKLNKEKNNLSQKNAELKVENRRLQSALITHQNNLEKVSNEYEELKQESADFIELKQTYEQTSKELAITKGKAKKVEIKNQQLQKNQNIKWFVVGASVLILGFIIGFSSRRHRRQASWLG
jgi:SH3 domain protein